MDRLITLHSSELYRHSSSSCSPTPSEMVRDIVLRVLQNHREDGVKWKNPENLEFEVINRSKLIKRYREKLSRKNLEESISLDSVLDGDFKGVKFFRKVPNSENTYRIHFITRKLLPWVPRRSFADFVRLSTETSV